MSNFLRPAIPASIGALAMLLAVIIFQTHESQDEQPVEKKTEVETNQLPPIRSGTQLSSFTPAAKPSTIDAPPVVPAKHSAATEVSQQMPPFMPEEDQLRSLQKMMADHEQVIALHDREARDVSWASRMEAKLQAAFQSMPENSKASMQHVDCRSQTCTVTISWPSREVAQQELSVPSNMVGSIPCGNRIVLPPETSGQNTYQATMLLECAGHQVDASS